MNAPSTAPVNGVPIALLDDDELLEWVQERITSGAGCAIVNHLAAHPTVEARRDAPLRQTLARADLNVADGMGTVWAARLLSGGSRPRARVYGPDFMLAAIEHGLAPRWRHAFVGGTPEILDRLLGRLSDGLPDVRIAAAYAPPFRPVTPETVREDVAALEMVEPVDILWVGLGTPKQQVWADLARPLNPARVICTVGAAFDFHAGAVRQAPTWMQRSGLEWAFRLSQDPRRLASRYLVGNLRHIAGVARDLPAARRARRAVER